MQKLLLILEGMNRIPANGNKSWNICIGETRPKKIKNQLLSKSETGRTNQVTTPNCFKRHNYIG